MERLRKFFSPQTGKGSQGQNEKEILGMYKIIKKLVKERKERYK